MSNTAPHWKAKVALLFLALVAVLLANYIAGTLATWCFPDGCISPPAFSPPIWEIFRTFPLPLALLFIVTCALALASFRYTGRTAAVMRISPLLFLLSIGTAALFFYP